MRTYKSNRPSAEKTKRNAPRRGVQAIAVSAAMVIIAVAIALALTFGLRKPPVSDDVQTDVPPVSITFSAPLNQCTVTKQASLNKLVYNETLKQWRTHNGVDFEAKNGDEVFTIAPGTVTAVEDTIIEGVVVTVTHANGYVSTYKGLASAAVSKDDKVEAGAKLGVIGNMMCEQNDGAHLHLEMKKDGKFVSATDYLDVETDK